MKQLKIVLAMTVLGLSIATTAQGQFTSNDFTIKTTGLSDEYATRYKESAKIEELVSIFNQLNITHDITPVVINVSYEDGEGYVLAEINYNHDKVFSSSSDYTAHNRNWSGYGKGISVFLQNQIFTALSQYKKSVATDGWSMDKDLLKFESAIKLKKENGDWILLYAYNYLDSRGFYPYTFYKNVHMQVDSKKYETETSNTKMLNDMKYFFVGKTTGIDGSKTGAYYFCKFFKIETE